MKAITSQNQQTLTNIYKIEVERLNALVTQLENEREQLKKRIESIQPKGRSMQIARLFMSKEQWS